MFARSASWCRKRSGACQRKSVPAVVCKTVFRHLSLTVFLTVSLTDSNRVLSLCCRCAVVVLVVLSFAYAVSGILYFRTRYSKGTHKDSSGAACYACTKAWGGSCTNGQLAPQSARTSAPAYRNTRLPALKWPHSGFVETDRVCVRRWRNLKGTGHCVSVVVPCTGTKDNQCSTCNSGYYITADFQCARCSNAVCGANECQTGI